MIRVYRALRSLFLLFAVAFSLAAQPAKVDISTPTGEAFLRLYNFDFPGSQAVLDRYVAANPELPLPYAVKAATLLFSELHRLKILELDFFQDDDRVVDRSRLTPDAGVKAEMFRLIGMAQQRADTVLRREPGDRDALFALCMSTGLHTDYAALIERRRFGSFPLAKRTQAYANQLLALDPPYYDAHLNSGATEYVIGSLHFVFRWFVRIDGIDGIEGNKRKAVEHLEVVAKRGKYYGPFARVLLAVVHLREKRPWESEKLLAGLAAEFPENPLFPKELARMRALANRTRAAAPGSPGN